MTETEDWGPIDPTQQELARTNASGVTWWAAEDEHGKPVQIENAVKGRTYHCPECETQMIPVQGAMRAWHFRHKAESSPDAAGCGGEGARHYRVKTMLLLMLRQIEADDFRYVVKFEPEKRIGEDQPDIVVRVGDQQVSGIEIIDSNPPSKEKEERWGDRLFPIHITKWGDRTIGNALLLSGKLLSRITAFRRFTEHIETTVAGQSEAIAAITRLHDHKVNELEAEHRSRIEALSAKLENEYESEQARVEQAVEFLRAGRTFPPLHHGTWKSLNAEQKIRANEWAVRTDIDAEPGVFVLIRRKKDGMFQTATIVKRMEEFGENWNHGTAVFRVSPAVDAPAIYDMVVQLGEEFADKAKEAERQRRRRNRMNTSGQ